MSGRLSSRRVEDVGVEGFLDDDAGYERWLAGHPDLYVVNTTRTPR
jgi:hypothetical protein